LGVWAANRSHAARARIKRWNRTNPLDPAELAEFTSAAAYPSRKPGHLQASMS
jgi:hypothetical protein